ncbi:MAG: hypothetical protein U9N50_04400 [Pseudomonadota bacterium]|nr:hypothetical protein [Pseudomonadota bacterium]
MNGILMNYSTALIIISLGALLASIITRHSIWRWLIVAVVILLSLIIPVVDSNIWLWINGAAGELSIVSMILLSAFILRKMAVRDLILPSTRIHLYIFILLAGILLYPATLGLMQFDPYALGYSFELSMLLLSISILYWIFKQQQMAVILLITVAVREAGILNSLNTWDYLIDPLLWLFSPVLLVLLMLEKRRAAAS